MSRPSIQVNTARLSPLSVGTVSRIQNGTDNLQQIELIQLQQNAMVFAVLSNPLPPAAGTITKKQEGTSERPEVWRLNLSPIPYDGSFDLTLDDTLYSYIPYNVTGSQLSTILGSAYTVRHVGNATWDIITTENGALAGAFAVDVTNLVVPKGVQGTLGLNTMAVWLAFVGNTAQVKTFTLEVQIVRPGGDPETILQMQVEISRNVINLATLEQQTLLQAQAAYAALLNAGVNAIWTTAITGLTGGGTNLDAEPTETKGLGFRIDFPMNGFIRKFVLKAGAADPANPTGEVAPLDYNATSNDKHWEEQT